MTLIILCNNPKVDTIGLTDIAGSNMLNLRQTMQERPISVQLAARPENIDFLQRVQTIHAITSRLTHVRRRHVPICRVNNGG